MSRSWGASWSNPNAYSASQSYQPYYSSGYAEYPNCNRYGGENAGYYGGSSNNSYAYGQDNAYGRNDCYGQSNYYDQSGYPGQGNYNANSDYSKLYQLMQLTNNDIDQFDRWLSRLQQERDGIGSKMARVDRLRQSGREAQAGKLLMEIQSTVKSLRESSRARYRQTC